MRVNAVQKIGYPFGFILIFSLCYFLLQIFLGLYIRQMGVAEEFVVEMIRDHELSVQVVSLLIVLFLFENPGKWRLAWPKQPWHTFESLLFTPNPQVSLKTIQVESPWIVLVSGLSRGLVLAALSVGVFRFLGWLQVDRGDFGWDTVWLILPYFFTQSLLFVLWILLLGKLRSRVADYLTARDGLTAEQGGLRYPFAMRIIYLAFEAHLLFRIFETDGSWTDRTVMALFCLLLSSTFLFLEEEVHAATSWAAHYFWKRKILKLGAVAGFWTGIFYVFGWKSGIPWKVSLYYSTEGPALVDYNGQLILLGLWVLLSNSILQFEELRRSRALRALARDLLMQRDLLVMKWKSARAAVRRQPLTQE